MPKEIPVPASLQELTTLALVKQLKVLASVLFCLGTIFGCLLAGPLHAVVFQIPASAIAGGLVVAVLAGACLCAAIFRSFCAELSRRALS